MTGSHSVCQKIWNSHILSTSFQSFVEASEFSRGSHLSAAKHRFCSFSKPMARFVLHFDAIVNVLNRAAAAGGASWAESWMANIDEAALFTLGMATDLASSCIQLTRFFDRDDMDISRINEEVYCFDQELEVRVANHGSQRVKLVFMSNMVFKFP